MRDKYKRELNKILQIGNMSLYRGCLEGLYGGDKVIELEEKVKAKFKVKHAIPCNSATSGIWAALNVLNISKDDEVIVTPYSMTCSASIPLLFHAKPVFCDIEKDFYCLDPIQLEARITSRTKAIIVVDLFGMPFSEEINKIAAKYNIPIIEDAAQAIGAKRNSKYAGTLGDIGILSFNQHKHINAGEGGMILTNNDNTAERLRYSINHAEAISNDTGKNIDLVGMNLRMTEYTALIVSDQFDYLDNILKSYRDHDFNIKIRENCISSYYKYAFTDTQKIDTKKYNTKKRT